MVVGVVVVVTAGVPLVTAAEAHHTGIILCLSVYTAPVH